MQITKNSPYYKMLILVTVLWFRSACARGTIISVIAGWFLVSVLSGCADSRYTAEKLFWQAQQEAAKILDERSGQLDDDDIQEVIAAYRKVTEAGPLESIAAKTQFIIANIYVAQAKYTEAQEELRRIIQNFSFNGKISSQAYFNIGNIFEAQGKQKEAIEEYEKIIDIYPLTPLGLRMPVYLLQYYQKVDNQTEAQRAYRSAARHYTALLDDFDQTQLAPVVSDYLAFVHLQKGKTDEAIEVWEGIVDEYPQSPQAVKSFLAKADLFARINNIPKLIQNYEEFINRYPGHKVTPQVKLKLGSAYVQNAQIEEAKNIFTSIIADYADDDAVSVSAYLGLTLCYRRELDTDKLLEVYGMIREKYPYSLPALRIPFLIGQYCQEAGYNTKADVALEEAIAEYKTVMVEETQNQERKKEAANLLVLSYLKKNEIENATALLRELSGEYPRDPVYLVDLATLYRTLNATEKAIAVYQELMQKYPGNELIEKLATTQINVLTEKQDVEP